MKSKKFYVGILTLAIVVGTGAWFSCQSPVQKYWAKNKTTDMSRYPASFFAGKDIQLYRDYFTFETFQKYLNYEMDVTVNTDKDGNYLKKKARLALHDTFAKSFSQHGVNQKNGVESSLLGLLKQNFMKSMINRFLKTLYVFKILDGEFQIDLSFTPVEEQNLSFKKELESNQLIDLNEGKSLSEFLESKKVNLNNAVHKSRVPNNGRVYEYNGGLITIWLKVADLSWNPLNPIPNPKKNAVKGFVRYRRYFRADNMSLLNPQFSGDGISIENIHFEKNKNQIQNFVTVDIYKTFNLKTLIPVLDRMEIHFGKLLPKDVHQDTLIQRIFTKNEKTIDTGRLFINGTIGEGSKSKNFATHVKKLVFNFKKSKFSDKSVLITKTEERGKGGRVKARVKDFFLKKYSHLFVDKFNLDRFHRTLKGGGTL